MPLQKELDAAKAKLRSITADYSAIRKDHARQTKRVQAAESAAASANTKADALGAKLEATRNRSMMLEERAKETAAALVDSSKVAASAPEIRANAHRYFEQLNAAREQLKTTNTALQAARKKIVRLEHGITIEVERTKALAKKSEPMQERNLALEKRIKSLAIRLKGANQMLDLLEADNAQLRKTLISSQSQDSQQETAVNKDIALTLDQIDKANQLASVRRDSVLDLRERLDVQNDRVRQLHRFNPVARVFEFSEAVLTTLPDTVDGLLTHGMYPMGIMTFAPPGRFKKIVNNCIEIPSLLERATSGKSDHYVRDWISRTLTTYLPECDTVLTVSNGLTQHIQALGCNDVATIPNFRPHTPIPEPNDLRGKFGISEDAFVILAVGNATGGWDAALRAIKASGEDVHCINLGTFSPSEYGDEVRALIAELDLLKRVHLEPPVPYEELSACCAAADVGAIIREPAVGNHVVSLPNRVFDFLSGGLPFLSPHMPDISRTIEEFDCGVVLSESTPEGWAAGIASARENAAKLRQGAAAANDALTWESHLPELKRVFDGTSHVAIAGIADLTKNNRTYRITCDLIEIGIDVSIFTKQESERARFINAGADVHIV